MRKIGITPLDFLPLCFFPALDVVTIGTLLSMMNGDSLVGSLSLRGSWVSFSVCHSISGFDSFASFPLSFPLGPACCVVPPAASLSSMVGIIDLADHFFIIATKSSSVTKYRRECDVSIRSFEP